MGEARFRRMQRLWRELLVAAFSVPLGELDPWVIERITTLLEQHPVHAGDILFKEGDPAEFVYFMERGRVRMTREGGAPWTFEGRWLLGGFELHLDRPRSRTAVALEDLEMLRAPADGWLDLLEDSFELTRRAVAAAATTVAKLEEVGAAGARQAPAGLRNFPTRPLDAVERLALLTEFPAFRGPGVQVLAELAAASDEVWLEAGESLGVGSALHLVASGEIEASREDGHVTRTASPFEVVLGAAAFAPALAAGWEAHAASRSRVLSIPIEVWYDVMEEHFDLARSTLALLAERREALLDLLAERSGPEGLVLR